MMTTTPRQSAVELLVRFAAATDPPAGSVRHHDGTEEAFSGWLGLLSVLENLQKEPQMTTNVAPIAHGPGQGEALWFLGQLVTIKSSAETTGGRVGVTETLAPRGSGSPLHVHRNEDEWFYVIEGELALWVGGEVITAPAGSFVYGPKDIPHTFTVTSDEARFLLVVQPAGFESFVRTMGEPAQTLQIPPAAADPPDMEALIRVAAEYGIEILGPPGIPS